MQYARTDNKCTTQSVLMHNTGTLPDAQYLASACCRHEEVAYATL